MSGLFRSEKVELYVLTISNESAYDILSELGYSGAVHLFESDDNKVPINERIFTKKIKEIQNTMDEIKFLESQLCLRRIDVIQCQDYSKWLKRMRESKIDNNEGKYQNFEQIKSKINIFKLKYENSMKYFEELIQSRNHLLEVCAIYKLIQETFTKQTNFKLFLGTINSSDAVRLERIVFRVSRGNCLCKFKRVAEEDANFTEQIIDPKTRTIQNRMSYIITIPMTSNGNTLDVRVNKILDSFNTSKLNDLMQQFQQISIPQEISQLQQEVQERNSMINQQEIQIEIEFLEFTKLTHDVNEGGCSQIIDYKLYCLQERYIFTQMNLLKTINQNFFRCYAWIQSSKEAEVIGELQSLILRQSSKHLIGQFSLVDSKHDKKRPTVIPTNAFTDPFQQIVNTYGIPRYQEINPGVFTWITFPFLFGIMYGDIAHGSLLFGFSFYLMAQEKSNSNSKEWNSVISTKYLVCLMGFFAMYNGLIYNDFMSMPLNLFGSCWNNKLTPVKDCTYPFGMDPAWNLGENKLAMYNSLKMKTSVIIGVTQMLLGIILKAFNCIFFGNMIDFFFEFIPQILFLMSTFGYMVILIFIKWNTDFTNRTQEAPSILTIMLNYGLKGGEVDGTALYETNEFQGHVQFTLLIIALICVPWMLFVKPAIHYYQHNKEQNEQQEYIKLNQEDVEQQNENEIKDKKIINQNNNQTQAKKEKEYDFAEEFVHQIIETIEFVLGSISHTASYLRLWALSLAHAQLSEVFFDKTLKEGIKSGNEFGIVIGFLVLAQITFGVLLCMDVMECFLHTLRLHWVEFQSKFYKSDGFLFEPFSFQQYLDDNARTVQPSIDPQFVQNNQTLGKIKESEVEQQKNNR